MGPSFKITFLPGKEQGKVDALSRHSYLAPHRGDPAFGNKKQVILGPTWLQATWIFDIPMDSCIIEIIHEDFVGITIRPNGIARTG